MLTDLEFRVWTQYLLSADDAGVMRMSPLTIQADNDALAKRPAKAIEKALHRIVEVGLLVTFDHQGRTYVCDALWQQFQKVQWPRPTRNPMPPASLSCSFPKEMQSLLERILKRSREGSQAKASGSGSRLEATATAELFEKFWAMYPRKVNKDAARREFDKLAPDNDLLDQMLGALHHQRASAQWVKDDGQYIPHARTWLHQKRWEDEVKSLKPKPKLGVRDVVPHDESL